MGPVYKSDNNLIAPKSKHISLIFCRMLAARILVKRTKLLQICEILHEVMYILEILKRDAQPTPNQFNQNYPKTPKCTVQSL
jgi:hypothetical protein